MSKMNILNEKLSKIFGSENTCNKYPLINKITVIYVGITVLTFILFLIAPFITLIAKTPFYSIKTYLGIIGAGLLCLDVFTNRVVWRGKYIYLLIGICACAAISTVTTARYGFKDNIFDLVWVTVQFGLIYSCGYRLGKASIKKFFCILI